MVGSFWNVNQTEAGCSFQSRIKEKTASKARGAVFNKKPIVHLQRQRGSFQSLILSRGQLAKSEGQFLTTNKL